MLNEESPAGDRGPATVLSAMVALYSLVFGFLVYRQRALFDQLTGPSGSFRIVYDVRGVVVAHRSST